MFPVGRTWFMAGDAGMICPGTGQETWPSDQGMALCHVCGNVVPIGFDGKRSWFKQHDVNGNPVTAGLKKGAPFAGYKDFDACVAANSDKDDPEAYCGKIKHQVEEGRESARRVHARRTARRVHARRKVARRRPKATKVQANPYMMDDNPYAMDGNPYSEPEPPEQPTSDESEEPEMEEVDPETTRPRQTPTTGNLGNALVSWLNGDGEVTIRRRNS